MFLNTHLEENFVHAIARVGIDGCGIHFEGMVYINWYAFFSKECLEVFKITEKTK